MSNKLQQIVCSNFWALLCVIHPSLIMSMWLLQQWCVLLRGLKKLPAWWLSGKAIRCEVFKVWIPNWSNKLYFIHAYVVWHVKITTNIHFLHFKNIAWSNGYLTVSLGSHWLMLLRIFASSRVSREEGIFFRIIAYKESKWPSVTRLSSRGGWRGTNGWRFSTAADHVPIVSPTKKAIVKCLNLSKYAKRILF